MSKRFVVRAIAGSLLALSGVSWAGKCSADHCSKVDKKVSELCQTDGSKGEKIYIQKADGSLCYCDCSCFAAGSEIELSSGRFSVEEILAGQMAKTPAGNVAIAKKLKSDVESAQAIELTVASGQKSLLSTNHPLIREDGVVVEVASVKPGMKLIAEDGSAITVVAVSPREYTGTFHNFILAGSNGSGSDRIVLSGGLQSGDWMVQSYRDLLKAELGLREVIARGARQ